MSVPEGQAIQTDADVATDRRVRRLFALALSGLVLSIPVSIIMGAVAEVIVALAAVPVALVLTRDGYVISAALSYGPFAAASSLFWLAIATGLWSLVAPFILARRHHLIALVSGVGVVLLGFILASYSAPSLPLTRAHTLSLPGFWPVSGIIIATGAGGLAGLVSVRRAAAPSHVAPTTRESLTRLTMQLALFAFCLALCLEISVAALAALNRF